jgi:YesN/AraC family two-component response regulator
MGFAAIGAKNGREAVDTAIAEKPDLIIMDIASLS